MKLHLLGLPHTVTNDAFSHCAFTGKVHRFSPMLRAQGFYVIHYGAAGAESGANEQVDVMPRDEHLHLLGLGDYNEHPQERIGDRARSDSPLYRQFNFYLRDELRERVEPGDVICLPFATAHDAALINFPLLRTGQVVRVETGIGYPRPTSLTRVYESEAWRHWVLGNEQREGMDWRTPRLEWVIPNYYVPDDWPAPTMMCDHDFNTVVYLGRLEDIKGCAIIPLLAARRPDLHFVICGQGDPAPYLGASNVEYRPPMSGRARATLLGRARCVLTPSRFIEPFCGVAVEAMLCGTPVLTSDFGAFTETVVQGTTGYRCRNVEQFVRGLDLVTSLSRSEIRHSALSRFSTSVVGIRYAAAFTELAERMADGTAPV